MKKIHEMPARTYSAKLFKISFGENEIHVAGTLEGELDVAFPGRTYQLSQAEACALSSILTMACMDVEANCLYDRDPLLAKP